MNRKQFLSRWTDALDSAQDAQPDAGAYTPDLLLESLSELLDLALYARDRPGRWWSAASRKLEQQISELRLPAAVPDEVATPIETVADIFSGALKSLLT